MMTTAKHYSMRILLYQAFVVVGGIILTPVQSYVVGGNNILSRFDFQCKLLMTVGRTPNTEMRELWNDVVWG